MGSNLAFGDEQLSSNGGFDAWVATFSEGGAEEYSKGFGGKGQDGANSIAVDTSGNIFVTGAIDDDVDFGGGRLVSAHGEQIFVASFDSSGNHRWATSYPTDGPNGEGVDIAAAPNGSVYIIGDFTQPTDFGFGATESSGGSDVYLMSVPADGPS